MPKSKPRKRRTVGRRNNGIYGSQIRKTSERRAYVDQAPVRGGGRALPGGASRLASGQGNASTDARQPQTSEVTQRIVASSSLTETTLWPMVAS